MTPFQVTDTETYYYTTRSLHARYTLAKRFTRNAEQFTRNDSRTKRFARFLHALDTLLSFYPDRFLFHSGFLGYFL